MSSIKYFFSLPFAWYGRLDSSDPLRVAVDNAWLYTKYAAIVIFILLNLTVVTGLPHVRWESTVHQTRTGTIQGESKYLGPLGFQLIEAEMTGPIPPRLFFIPLTQCLAD
ncbi:hypothetical protein [Rhodopirellula europaea]|uniref:hypothetical protein n=1 Tax=Rhodopirellula europaea TaxID=1263866 RepID=UPI003D2B046E